MITIEKETVKKYSRSKVHSPFQGPASLFQIYHENTKLAPLTARAYYATVKRYARSSGLLRLSEQPYKLYTLMDQEELAPPRPASEIEHALIGRRSVRAFTGEAIRADELSRLLFAAYGRTGPSGRFRGVPSGGALYPLEWYVCVLRAEGLEEGVYHYDAENHRLDAVQRGPFLERMKEAVTFDAIEVDDAAVVLVATAVFRRSTLKYQDRGYRMVLMEAGGAAQNVALLATHLGLGTCYVGGFLDDALGAVLGVDGLEEAPLLPVVVGRARGAPGEAR